MRWLFIFLLLVNVTFFGWHYVHKAETPPAAVKPDTVPVTHSSLRLLSELVEDEMPPLRGEQPEIPMVVKEVAAPVEKVRLAPVEEQGAPAEVESSPDTMAVEVKQPPARNCYRLFAITNTKTVTAMAGTIEKSGGEVINTGETPVQLKRYRVLLPYTSRSAADSAMKQLKRKKVRDFYRMENNSISLGVFSSRETALRRMREINALKIKIIAPKLEGLEVMSKRYWLLFSGPQEIGQQTWRSRLQGKADFEMESAPCP